MTPHIEAAKDKIAKVVIMPGDPLRAKFIAEKFLENYELVNTVRNIYAYTGYYNGKLVTVMASGMGMPSIGIYSYELYYYYDVETIIRIGTCGGNKENMHLFDIILATDSYTEGNFALTYDNQNIHMIDADFNTNEKLKKEASKLGISLIEGTVLTSEGFDKYIDVESMKKRIPANINYVATEMEAFALFYTAKRLNRKAACLLTVVDLAYSDQMATPEQREQSLCDMIKIALESI